MREICRAVVTGGPDDHAIALHNCSLLGDGERLLLDGIRRNRGPRRMHQCILNNRLLADALCVNTSIKSLNPHMWMKSNMSFTCCRLSEKILD